MASETPSNLFGAEGEACPRILSFASATGGVGSTLLAANLGIHLAKKGKTVLLADLALTEAGCHLALGMLKPERHLGSLVLREAADVRDAVVPTSVNNLSLLAGCPDLPEVANMAYLTKQKVLSSLPNLPYDYVIVDAGGGTGLDALDFFLAGHLPVVVVQAAPVGVEPFYRFLRAVLRRLLMESLNKKRYQALSSSINASSPLAGFWELPETREEDLAAVERAIRSRRFSFAQSGLTSEKDTRLGAQLESLLRRYFLCPFRFLGGLEWDAQAAQAQRNLEPIAKAYPMCPYSLSVEKLANALLKEEKEPRPEEGHLTPLPLNEMNAYQLIEAPYNATTKEIQSAYAKVMEPYQETSPLTLSLYTKEEREAIREMIDDAYKTLITTSLRQKYDEELITSGQMSAEQRVAEYREPAAEGTHPSAPAPQGGTPTEDTGSLRVQKSLEAVLQEVKIFDGPGLHKIREAQGISLAEIVEETNIRAWYLESIEAERFDVLPGLIYLKGFVKQLAQYLHLDPERVLADYLERYQGWKQQHAGE